jgi:hypothetical protein
MISTKKIVFQELLGGLIASINGLTQLWHQHLEHLNIQSLHFLSQKGLPTNILNISTQIHLY